MNTPIEFYFDFTSPYAYLASTRIDQLAAELDRTVDWRPILLGPIFKQTGSTPLVEMPLKGTYALHDLVRTARIFDIAYRQPDPFPVPTVKAARAMLWIKQALGSEKASEFAQRTFHAYFVRQKNISELQVVLDVAGSLDIDPARLARAIEQEDIKNALRSEIADAMARGVFGAPFLFVDGEPFWGFDRYDHIRKWIRIRAAPSPKP